MCGGGGGPAPPPKVDPEAERLTAAANATASANAKIIADKRRKRSASNLLGALGDGLDTLGGLGIGASVLGVGAGQAVSTAATTATSPQLSASVLTPAGIETSTRRTGGNARMAQAAY